MTTLPRVFHGTAKRLGERTALRSKELGLWRDISWNEYYERAGRVALGLRALGLEKGDRVAVAGDNCAEWVQIDMGIQCGGGVTVGIYTTSPWQQCEYVVSHSGARFFFVENEEQLDKWLAFRDRTPALEKVIVWDTEGLRDFSDPMVVTLDALMASASESDLDFDRLEPADAAMIIYTSGTTGPPKGAVLSHGNVVWMTQTLGEIDDGVIVREDDEVLSFLPLCHIFERLFSVILHVAYGYTVSFVEGPDTVAENLAEISPTVGYGVPRIWEKFHSQIAIRMEDATWLKKLTYRQALRAASSGSSMFRRLAHFVVFNKLKKRLGLDRMRIAFSGAAPIAPEILRYFQTIGLNLVEGYGQTESSGVISGVRASRVKLGTVGIAIPGLELKIADDGEILVRSPGVFQGYFENDDATRHALRDGWLHTGDIGEIDDEGFLRIVDRKKDLIITAGGKNIAPQYLENLLKCSPYINDAVVIGDGRKYLTALVVLDEDNIVKLAQDRKIPFSTYTQLAGEPDIVRHIEQEIDRVNKQVSRVENVRKFRILPKRLYEEDGEVTPTMKVKRTSIAETYADLIGEMYE